MPRRPLLSYGLLGLLAIVLLLTGMHLMRQTNPFFAGPPHITREKAQDIVNRFISSQAYNLENFFVDSYFAYDVTGIDYLMRTIGVEATVDLANREALPLTAWEFYYYLDRPRDDQEETYLFKVSPTGRLLGFRHQLPDSTTGGTISTEQAVALADSYLRNWRGVDYLRFTLEQTISDQKTGRTDYLLRYRRQDVAFGDGAEIIEVKISGANVTTLMPEFEVPSGFASSSGVVGTANVLFNAASVMTYILMTILALAVFLRKYHRGEVGVSQAFKAGGVLYLLISISAINTWGIFARGAEFGQISFYQSKFVVLGVQMVTSWVTMALNVLSAWSAGMHETRRVRPQALQGITSVLHHRWITAQVGRELPAGLAYGAILFGGVYVLMSGMISFLGVSPRIDISSYSQFGMYLPVLGIASYAGISTLFNESVFRLFFIPYLVRKNVRPLLAICFSAAVYALFSIFFNDTFSLWPAYFTLVPTLFFGLVQGLVFWRYGFLAAMISSSFYALAILCGPLLASEEPFFFGHALLAWLIVAILLVLGLVALWRGPHITFEIEEEPTHIRRIKERTRLQKELEIARRVQLGLLPRINPKLSGFDIAGVCLPAQEVGGDYFDFIALGEGRLGIAIGDVSGKGVPAAIYMTLTKGVLQSQAESALSPKQVLGRVNSLLHRNIERSWYVSMFYAVLRSDEKRLCFARAGHHPAIVFNKRRTRPLILQPGGIALGLDCGEVFERTLVEGEITLEPGDTLVLYTDGLTEAMNGKREEFGEPRLLTLLREQKSNSAEGLLQQVISAVQDFVGEAPQHDDMTIVVLQVH